MASNNCKGNACEPAVKLPQTNVPIHLNGNIHITCAVLKLVSSSAATVEVGAFFVNTKEAKVMRLNLSEIGHSQPSSPIHVDNTSAMGIVTHTIRKSKSQSIEMSYVLLLDQDTQNYLKCYYVPGLKCLAG